MIAAGYLTGETKPYRQNETLELAKGLEPPTV
jgi:hypothetical protein